MFKVEKLTCRRGMRTIFRDVTFNLEPGAFLWVTGANGSGKSSLLRILAGLLPTAEGGVFWQRMDVSTDWSAHRERLHYIGHLDAVKPELTAHEMLGYWQVLRSDRAGKPALHALEALGIAQLADKPVRILSAGQKRRLALARLMLNDAPLWLLDEPTTGLDQHAQKNLDNIINMHRAKGGIVIAAMHHPSELPNVKIFEMPGAA